MLSLVDLLFPSFRSSSTSDSELNEGPIVGIIGGKSFDGGVKDDIVVLSYNILYLILNRMDEFAYDRK